MYGMGLRILSVLKEMWVFKYVQSFWVSAWVMWFAWSFWVREVIIKWDTRETREHSFSSFWVYWRVLQLKSEKTRNYVRARISAQRQSVSNGFDELVCIVHTIMKSNESCQCTHEMRETILRFYFGARVTLLSIDYTKSAKVTRMPFHTESET